MLGYAGNYGEGRHITFAHFEPLSFLARSGIQQACFNETKGISNVTLNHSALLMVNSVRGLHACHKEILRYAQNDNRGN
jgi:hypothetical protein